MRAILGIGNPGSKYENTRHNIGFKILDKFAERHKLVFKSSSDDYYYAGSFIKASPFILIKPTTFVNLTGQAVIQLLEKYKIDLKNLLVVLDDVNLPPGKLRIRKSGGDGGHNGLYSIIYTVMSNEFPRLRFGIGNDFEYGTMADYVLTQFNKEETDLINGSIISSVRLIEKFIEGGIELMLSEFSKSNITNVHNSNNINEGN
ncbi:MAG: aminoacyl-tRNA hydrolase [Melioribacteraceae bacterium]|nr:aminoacyl-tRNA hydrolase [Melioribacteraceae bacterium]